MTVRTFLENPYSKEIKANIVNKEQINDNFHITLDRTIFYPHLAGAQPRDYGTIQGKEVIDVYEKGDDIIHVLREDINQDKVDLVIDWSRRFDLMQQHTAQHLLSANLFSLYNTKTLSSHFADDHLTIEIDKPSLNEKEVKQLEYLTNNIIQSNFKITSYAIDSTEAEGIPLKEKPDIDGPIRIVEIENIDFSACIGTHLNSTGEIGILKIRKWYKFKDHMKIDFVAGNRAILDYGVKNNDIYDLSKLLDVNEKDLVGAVEDNLYEKERLKETISDLRIELAKTKANLFLANSSTYGNIKYIVNTFHNGDLKEISKISNYLNEIDNIIQIYSIKNEGESLSQFFISRSYNLNIDLRSILNQVSENEKVRGGGSQYTIQGATPADSIDNIIRSFYSNIRNFYRED